MPLHSLQAARRHSHRTLAIDNIEFSHDEFGLIVGVLWQQYGRLNPAHHRG